MRARTWSCLRSPNVSGAARKLALFVIGLPLLAQAAPAWKIQFSYQKLDSLLELRDLVCPSIQLCIAVGVISEKSGRQQGVVVLTADGGKQWSQVDVKERPLSLF